MDKDNFDSCITGSDYAQEVEPYQTAQERASLDNMLTEHRESEQALHERLGEFAPLYDIIRDSSEALKNVKRSLSTGTEGSKVWRLKARDDVRRVVWKLESILESMEFNASMEQVD